MTCPFRVNFQIRSSRPVLPSEAVLAEHSYVNHLSYNSMSSSSFAPPLPVGWTEHAGLRFYFSYVIILLNRITDPGGNSYYFNSQTQESTYVRPLPPFFTSSHASHPLRNKERPLVKTPIPGTDWIRVRTTEGNTFYSHKIRKESVWIVPEEIESDVKAFEQQEREREDMSSRKEPVGENELENSPQEEPTKHEGRKSVKRKVDHSVPLDEVEITKRTKVAEEEESEESEESEEEDWQREAAAQLADEAAEERKRVEEEERRAKEAEAEAKRTTAVNIPEKVNLSLDEAKALFKVKVWLFRVSVTISDSTTDPLEGKGYQPFASLGYMSASICVRPEVYPPSLSRGSSGGL